MSDRDPLTGTWVFCPERSQWAGRPPQHWVQTILVEGEEIAVREEIVFGAEPQPDVLIRARLDEQLYPVSGSAAADHVAYQRTGTHTLLGTAYKEGRVCLRETLTVSAAGDALCMEYLLTVGERELAGIAVFVRSQGDSLGAGQP